MWPSVCLTAFFNGLGFGRRIESLAGEFDKSLERENDVVDAAAG